MSDERAFPIQSGQTIHMGMTLRDYFAAQAMIGRLSQPWHPAMGVDWRIDEMELAGWSYDMADRMMLARKIMEGEA